ncbi:MAG TPA: hypothetical protein PLV05_04780 [Verrucomicrobiota bacterium]|nr:hypothetical protein [Limisphaerales bacterium]HPC52400.1 hypothetical protein [Verrucomicrobiota bacterium]HRR63726.1 hypothetical protein [Candidatus Paceibacterota bacterium]HRV39854.1 hypothetical protein [Candidatus Paceibacterota bacterium]
MSCMKPLYLADRSALLQWGRPITTDRDVSLDRGPALSRVLDLTADEKSPGQTSVWTNHITEPEHYSFGSAATPVKTHVRALPLRPCGGELSHG